MLSGQPQRIVEADPHYRWRRRLLSV